MKIAGQTATCRPQHFNHKSQSKTDTDAMTAHRKNILYTEHTMHTQTNLTSWSLEQDETLVQWARAHLSPDERRREARFATPDLRKKYAVGRGVMRHILSDYMGCRPQSIVFEYGAHGKPSARGGPLFNLSHSRSLACLAVTNTAETEISHIGVDIEWIAAIEDGLADSVFAPEELEVYLSLKAENRTPAFFRCWTQKEAVMKATGLGMSLDPKSFSIDFLQGKILSLPKCLPVNSRWEIREFVPLSGVAGALAVVGTSQAPTLHLEHTAWQP